MDNVPRMERSELASLLLDAASQRPQGDHVPDSTAPLPPDLSDLYFLYCLIRDTAVVSILEFGSGWSTLVQAIALSENRAAMTSDYVVRHPNPFQLLTIEADPLWLDTALSRIPAVALSVVRPHLAAPRLVEIHGVFVSVFADLPYFSPDLIYLDGPDPDQVAGTIDGFSAARGEHGMPMSGDILRIEPYLWPGTVIVTDGRSANARMLETALQRQWQCLHDPFGDRTIFRLAEPHLGHVSRSHDITRLRAAHLMRQM